MTQLLCHLWGDYILQSDWMALNKTKAWLPALAHVSMYCIPFVFLRPSLSAWAVIFGTHLLIDRFRLARYVVWAKNWIAPSEMRWVREISEWHRIPANWPLKECPTGYPPDRPDWMTVWLLIIADNILHLTINFAALKYL